MLSASRACASLNPIATSCATPAFVASSNDGGGGSPPPTESAAIGATGVATGFAMAIPEGYEVQVRPRSGLALKHGISLPNTPGTIDADYRGEIRVNLINHGKAACVVNRGDRIAQMIIAPVTQAVWEVADTLDETARGEGGFGSTGI